MAKADITLQAGGHAVGWWATSAAIPESKDVGDFFGKAVRGKVTGESAIKPEYTGTGTLVLEPTYRFILLIDLKAWNNSIVLDDGLFLGLRLPSAAQGGDALQSFIRSCRRRRAL